MKKKPYLPKHVLEKFERNRMTKEKRAFMELMYKPEKKPMKIYVASSWKNRDYNALCDFLTLHGHTCLDWRVNGFGWNETTDVPVEQWGPYFYRDTVLETSRAKEGFKNDYDKMAMADCCILLLPCGRSAHLEAGWFVGNGKPLHIFIQHYDTPELMYKMATSISFDEAELLKALNTTAPKIITYDEAINLINE